MPLRHTAAAHSGSAPFMGRRHGARGFIPWRSLAVQILFGAPFQKVFARRTRFGKWRPTKFSLNPRDVHRSILLSLGLHHNSLMTPHGSGEFQER